MSMIVGASDCSTGMAKALHDAFVANPASGTVDGAALKAFCFALATAIVNYIQANAGAYINTQVLGAMPSSTAANTPIKSLSDAGLLGVTIPIS